MRPNRLAPSTRLLALLRPIFRGALLLAMTMSAAGLAAGPNKALKLDGKGSYVELPSNIFKDLTQATIEVWARWETFGSFSRVFDSGAGWQSISIFNHATTRDLRFNVYPRFAKNDPSAQFNVRAPGLLHSNEWIHLAAVSGPGGMRLYANGILVGQHTNATSFADLKVFQTNYLGRGLVHNPGDRDFTGEIDEVRVWNHRRTSTQIRDNMHKRLTGREDGLVLLCSFDDGTANDLSPHSNDGRMMGNAKIVPTDLSFPDDTPPQTTAPATTDVRPVPAVRVAANAPPDGTAAAVWWIAGALSIIVTLLAWFAFTLRHRELSTPNLISAGSPPAALAGKPIEAIPAPNAPPATDEMKQRALAELTEFAKQSLVQGLYSQRSALLEAHQKALQELADLESRVVALHLPDRIAAYEKRIAELEKELDNRSDELRELTQATLQVLRQRLAEEKQSALKGNRFN